MKMPLISPKASNVSHMSCGSDRQHTMDNFKDGKKAIKIHH